MKLKRKFIILVIVIVGLLGKTKIKANPVPGWEFYPQGINYLSSDYFYFYNSWPSGHYISANYLKVKPNTQYNISSYQYQEMILKNINIHFYDINKQYIKDQTITLGFENYYQFVTDDRTEYLKITIRTELVAQYGEFEYIDKYLALYEGEKIVPPFDNDYMCYHGPNYEYTIILPEQTGHLTKNFDDYLSVSSILENIYAYDDYDGNITNNIQVVNDNYSQNINKLGEWDITFRVSDSTGNTSDFILYITNIDLVDPEITGIDYYETTPNQRIEIQEIINNLQAYDNYDGDCSNNITVLSDYYSTNYNNLGTYEIVFQVTDSSDNICLFSVNVVVEDNVPPVILGPEVVYRNKDETLTVEEIQALLMAYDNVDGDITDRITLIFDEYTPNANHYGYWETMFKVIDNAGNVDYLSVYVEVVDNLPPVFLIDQNTINVDLHNNNLEIPQIIDILIRTKQISPDGEVEVIQDEYSANKDQAGSYKVLLQTKDKQLKITVNVIDNLDEEIEPIAKASFWARLAALILRVLKYIWSFLKGIFK